MKQDSQIPPPVLDSARVLKYAVLDDSVKFSGRTLLFVDGKELDPAPCLAICKNLEDDAILLFHCDQDWNVLGAAGYGAIDEAERRAERIYQGVSARWIEPNFSDEEVSRYFEGLRGSERCTFCGKASDEANALLEKSGKWICDVCVEEFHEMLREEPQASDDSND
jgi:hypothetical protein